MTNADLDKLDALYIRAYETRSVNILKPFCKPEFLYKLARLFSLRPRYFADPMYRENSWELTSKNGSEEVYVKTCTYKVARLGPIKKVKISEDYSEDWKVLNSGKGYTILDIGEEK